MHVFTFVNVLSLGCQKGLEGDKKVSMSCLPSRIVSNLHVSKKEFLLVVFGFGFRFFVCINAG